jgi:serine/threonine protein phosphatase 1
MPRLIAIGDIHGCSTALKTLIEAIAPRPDDTVVTLGDYIDRGPDSRGVIDLLIQLESKTQLVGLLGNHEEMMLEVIRNNESHHRWCRFGGEDTLDSYGFDGDLKDVIPESHLRFLEQLGDYYETDKYFFTHAAYDPLTPLVYQHPELLRWYSLREGVPTPHMSGKKAVVGHTADEGGEILDVGHLLCIDTYCYGGGWLTGYDLTNGRIYQTNEAGELRQR